MGISTHVLDTATGRPAAGVGVRLERMRAGTWEVLSDAETDVDGRSGDLLGDSAAVERGVYRVRFETGAYFAAKGERCLYPFVEIVFEVMDARHYHIPLLLTANGFTTYRGS